MTTTMDSGSVLSEPAVNRSFAAERSASMSALSTINGQPRLSHLETLEAKMASIEVSLTNTPRRRKGSSLGGTGTISARASPRPPSVNSNSNNNSADTVSLHSNGGVAIANNQRTALQEREAIIQNLRQQLGLKQLPQQPNGVLSEAERQAAEQRLQRLKNDSDNKRNAIRNLKAAIEKLDATNSKDIDLRIRQAELEYALGREELQLISLVDEMRALQNRIERSLRASSSVNTLFNVLRAGANLSLHALRATVGHFGITSKDEAPGLYIEWALDGEGLFRGDRLIEVNGKIVETEYKDDVSKTLGDKGSKCNIVVIRKRQANIHVQQLIQSQEDNQRLQHRISYLEDQVNDLLESTKEIRKATVNNDHACCTRPTVPKKTNGHVTSINISTMNGTNDKPQIYQRGNYVTTIVDGKPITPPPPVVSPAKTPKTPPPPPPSKESNQRETNGFSHREKIDAPHPKPRLYNSASKISINSDSVYNQMASAALSAKRERERHREYDRNTRNFDRHNSNPNLLNGDSTVKMNGTMTDDDERPRRPSDMRSVKSLDFEKDSSKINGSSKPNGIHRKISFDVDYTSEPVAMPLNNSRPRNGMRPTPPKKPLRLSLQRARSLQTIEANANAAILDLEKKRAIKRSHCGNKTASDLTQHFENGNVFNSQLLVHQSASLGRSTHF